MQHPIKKISNINLQHGYFNETGISEGITLGPQLFNAPQSIKLKATQNGCFLYAESDAENKISSICIPVQFTDPKFFNYTDLDYDPSKIYYFGATGNTKKLSPILLPLHSSSFDYPIEASDFKKLKTLKLKKPIGEIQELEIPESLTPSGYFLDLSDQIIGKYQLQLEFKDSEKDTLYDFVHLHQFHGNPPHGIVEWQGNPQLINEAAIEDFTLVIKERSVFWQYIFPVDENNFKDLKISSFQLNSQEISFEKAKESFVLPDGNSALTFISSAVIPFQARPGFKIQCSANEGSINISLPFAMPDNGLVRQEEENRLNYISNIFVYL